MIDAKAYEDGLAVARRVRSEGGSVEEMLTLLRQLGFWQIDSMKVLLDVEGVTLGEAKRIVLLSAAWAAELDDTKQFHEELEQAVVDAVRDRTLPGVEMAREHRDDGANK